MSKTQVAPWIGFWPYEERFELTTKGDLLQCNQTLWEEVSSLAGATTVASDVTPFYHSYVLSLSSLIIFPHRLVLITCSRCGIADAVDHLLTATAALTPTYAASERRAPPPSSPYIPIASLKLPSYTGVTQPPLTKVSLFHNLRSRITLTEVEEIVSAHLPKHSLLSHQFSENGISLNALERNSYVSLHYTEDVYLSLEGSCTSPEQWATYHELVLEIQNIVTPEFVAGSHEWICYAGAS